jgi:hypothetical protein
VARVKERVSTFERRSGRRYEPSDALVLMARPLRPAEACPTLFRQPGPVGLASFLRGGLSRLGAPESPWLWLADDPARTSRRAARLFGVIAVLEPLRLEPCVLPGRKGHYLAANRPLGPLDTAVWTPPSAVAAGLSFDRIRTREQALRRFGRHYEDERQATLDALGAYLEELSALARAGVPSPFGPWCAVPRQERRRLLSKHRVEARWTR